jgi:hypothetical protein
MQRKIIANLIIVALIAGLTLFLGHRSKGGKLELDTPSPALGKTIATAIHEAVTDPYFAPLEKLGAWMEANPGRDRIGVDMLTKWAPDDEIPACFVWETDGSKLQLDHPADPDLLERLTQRLKESLGRPNPDQLLHIASVKVNGERFWIGFVGLPAGSASPVQVAGVYFSMDEYLRRAVPRLVNAVADRARFPLVNFQHNDPPIHGEIDGDISIRILDKSGEVFYQRGRTFDPDKMLYSESRYYPKPIVAMQEGWDLQVFSSKVKSEGEAWPPAWMKWSASGAAMLLTTVLIWYVI